VHGLLKDGKPGPARWGLLTGTVARALVHANERFATHHGDRGLASVIGAMYLVRSGEFRQEMIADRADALGGALAVVAGEGDEGRSMALLNLRKTVVPAQSAERRDADEHLQALDGWMKDTLRGSSLEIYGRQERVAVARLLLEPTTEAMTAARDATLRWIDRAIKFQEERSTAFGRPKREEAMEAFRAFRSGAETLAAIYLRSGDASGAFNELERTSLRKMAPALYDRLQATANGGGSRAWRDLLAWLWNPDRRDDEQLDSRDDPELSIDQGLLKAALWGTAVEAYRRDPTHVDVNMMLAALLVQLGLPETAPIVLADAVVPRPDPATLSGSLGFVLQEIEREDEADDTATARRVFAAADPLLVLASRPEWKGRLDPSPARIRLVMGALETRAGNLAAARPLLEAASSVEPSAEALITLASIDRQSGKPQAALAALARALETSEARQSPMAAGEAHLSSFEIQRELGAADKARSALSKALGIALDARKRANSPAARAHAERLLARVLDRFSDTAGAARATERAYEASGNDKHELAATVLDATARAFLRHDDSAARKAVSRGLSADLGDDDIVYAALWLQLLYREMKVKPDGSAARALASVKDDGRWSGRLASWGLGKLKDQELLASARTLAQKTEAAFYIAIAQRIAGDVTGGNAGLKQVSQSPAIDLVEVQLARDLLAGPARYLTGPTPVASP
jgi:tetratricopeptide (TPR) repeat protein